MSSEDARRVDRLFIAASAIVWSAITVFAVVSIVTSSTTGVVFAFVAIIAGALAWGKIVRRWLELRVSGSSDIKRLENEIRMLREAIERLRQSLES